MEKVTGWVHADLQFVLLGLGHWGSLDKDSDVLVVVHVRGHHSCPHFCGCIMHHHSYCISELPE